MINILIPMAGRGKRFADAGFELPKPLIDVCGKPMIQVVVENVMMPNAHFIYAVRREHCEEYGMAEFLRTLTPECSIVIIDDITEGTCCTTLLAEKFIDNDDPVLIVNSDQYIPWDAKQFYSCLASKENDGCILVFPCHDPNYSYVRLIDDRVVEVREKEIISDTGTVGLYYWQKGSDYVRYAKQMIKKDIRTKGEFYVAPVYNEAIADGKIITTLTVCVVHSLGTPEDLYKFISTHDNI